MKSVFTAVIALLIIGTGAYPQEMIKADHPIMKFASFAADKQLDIDEWTITIKEKRSITNIEEIKKEMQSLAGPSVMLKESLRHAEKYLVMNSHKNTDLVETYILIVPKNKESSAELVYTIEGQGTPSLTPDQNKKLSVVKSRLFTNAATIFSCLKASFNGIMNDVLIYQAFKQAFNVTTINEVEENGWTSRSGYTNQWDQSIPTGEQSMNVQFASRTLGGETNITIGTPIITAEY